MIVNTIDLFSTQLSKNNLLNQIEFDELKNHNLQYYFDGSEVKVGDFILYAFLIDDNGKGTIRLDNTDIYVNLIKLRKSDIDKFVPYELQNESSIPFICNKI